MSFLDFITGRQGALILERLETIMATQQQFSDALDRVNTATNSIASLLRDYVEQVKAGGMTAEQEEASLTRLNAAAEALEQMAQGPTDPVPVEPPEV
jgi:septum formation topological specificity factor MinE